ncbi:methionyl-tRNA formyltransferase [Salinibacter sp. 10B]|uniref:methionyl-tRNA formyltransferase n=1 Tax=Salinibacter sp. 10B TaxID=1923971 RepID=UPI000CF5371C|nr:methionyl-tRNA formyltransferase [Salinibacter sp. 10B]PQJ34060.1 methionyl-tRNA formyltransferase [Salinibacter sp. 10B]
MRIVFMGTPEFAVPSLTQLIDAGYDPVAVATGPDRPRGRGQEVTPTPVKAAAQEAGIERILQPEDVTDDAFAEAVAALEPDVIAVVAYKILPPSVFTAASEGAFNLHGSLLPKYRGAAPINHAIMQGETETGVTTFFLEPSVDTGDIILQKSMTIGPNETAGSVHDRMKVLGGEAVVETVEQIEAGTVDPRPQDDSQATPAPKIHDEDCEVPWGEPGEAVHNHVRGLSPYPGAWTMHGDTRLKLYRTRRAEGNGAPGEILSTDGRLVVACGQEAVEVVTIQQPGKQRLDAEDFLNGYALSEGERLGHA